MTKTVTKEDDLPRFKIMSDVDMEIALKKSLDQRGRMSSKEVMQTKDLGIVRQKIVEMKTSISDHDLGVQLDKIRKWLEKGRFVKVAIKGPKDDQNDLQTKICDTLADQKELVSSRLMFQLKK